MSMQIVDVSSHQDLEHLYPSVFGGEVDAIFVKATQSTGYVTPCFREFVQRCLDAGIRVGLYHYIGSGSVEDQMAHFVNQAGDLVGRVHLMVDEEDEQNPNMGDTTFACRCIDELAERYGITRSCLWVYSGGKDAWRHSACCDSDDEYTDDDHQFMVASYKDNVPDYNRDYQPWSWDKYPNARIIQWTSQRYFGSAGPFDCSESTMTVEEWDEMLGGDMAISNEDIDRIVTAINQNEPYPGSWPNRYNMTAWTYDNTEEIKARLAAMETTIQALAATIEAMSRGEVTSGQIMDAVNERLQPVADAVQAASERIAEAMQQQ